MAAQPAGDTAILGLWLPVFFFAHVFAGYWLFRALFLMNPQLASSFRRLLCCEWFTKKAQQAPDKQPPGTDMDRANSLDSRVLSEAVAAPAGAHKAGHCPGRSQTTMHGGRMVCGCSTAEACSQGANMQLSPVRACAALQRMHASHGKSCNHC